MSNSTYNDNIECSLICNFLTAMSSLVDPRDIGSAFVQNVSI